MRSKLLVLSLLFLLTLVSAQALEEKVLTIEHQEGTWRTNIIYHVFVDGDSVRVEPRSQNGFLYSVDGNDIVGLLGDSEAQFELTKNMLNAHSWPKLNLALKRGVSGSESLIFKNMQEQSQHVNAGDVRAPGWDVQSSLNIFQVGGSVREEFLLTIEHDDGTILDNIEFQVHGAGDNLRVVAFTVSGFEISVDGYDIIPLVGESDDQIEFTRNIFSARSWDTLNLAIKRGVKDDHVLTFTNIDGSEEVVSGSGILQPEWDVRNSLNVIRVDGNIVSPGIPDVTSEQDVEALERTQQLTEEGDALLNAGDYDGAAAKYTEAMEVAPTDYKKSNLYMYRGITKEFAKNDQGAFEDHQRAVELNPNNELARIRLEQVEARLQLQEQEEVSPAPAPPRSVRTPSSRTSPPPSRSAAPVASPDSTLTRTAACMSCRPIDLAWRIVRDALGIIIENVVDPVWNPEENKWQNYDEYYRVAQPTITPRTTSRPAPSVSACGSTTSTELSDIRGQPSISARTINKILSDAGSPAAGSGEHFVKYSKEYNVDAAFALGFFRQESSYGKAGVAKRSKGIGNIKYGRYSLPEWKYTAGGSNPGPWSAYYTFEKSIKGWFNFITQNPRYIQAGKNTLEEILPVYAPSSDRNKPQKYAANVKRSVQQYRNLERELCGTAAATPFSSSSGEFRYVVVSDYHSGSQLGGASGRTLLMNSIKAVSPQFVIFNGDTVNSRNTGYQDRWTTFFDEIANPLANDGIAVFQGLGNHDAEAPDRQGKLNYHNSLWTDFYNQNSGLYTQFQNFDYSNYPYHSFDYQGKKFMIMSVPGRSIDGNQMNWLNRNIQPGSFVFGHVPVVNTKGKTCTAAENSAGAKTCDRYRHLTLTGTSKTQLLDTLQRTGSIFFGGHIHTYYLTNYRGAGQYNIPIVMVGNAGADNRGIFETYNRAKSIPQSFVVVDVGNQVEVNAQIKDGNSYRWFTDSDAAKYWPTDAEMREHGQDQLFAPFAIQLTSS